MRNSWETGLSVYLSSAIPLHFGCTPPCEQIILNAVAARPPAIPTLSAAGLTILAGAFAVAGIILIRARRPATRLGSTVVLVLGAFLTLSDPAHAADVIATDNGGVTQLRIGDAEPFHITESTVTALRSIAIPDAAGMVVLWNEVDAGGSTTPWYAIAPDGTGVDLVRSTTYDLPLGSIVFDPAIEEPALPASLMSPDGSELHIVQYVTQPLPEFNRALQVEGATFYHFLPDHSYVVRLSAEAVERIGAFPFIRALVPFHPAYRVEPVVRRQLADEGSGLRSQPYNIQVFEPEQKLMVADRIKSFGGHVDSPDTGKHLLVATLTAEQIVQVAGWNEVAFVDRWGPMEPDMNIARVVGGADYLEAVAAYRGTVGPQRVLA